MIENVKKEIRDKHGGASFQTAALVLVIAMLFALVLSYASFMTIISTTKDNTKRCLDSFVMQNSTLIYKAIKEGRNFTDNIDETLFIQGFEGELSVDFQNGLLYSVNDKGNVIFKMTSPDINFKVDNTLNLITTYNLMLPVDFAGRKLFDLIIPIEVEARYALKNE